MVVRIKITRQEYAMLLYGLGILASTEIETVFAGVTWTDLAVKLQRTFELIPDTSVS